MAAVDTLLVGLESLGMFSEGRGSSRNVSKKDLARFRKWFAEYDATIWDQQLEPVVGAR